MATRTWQPKAESVKQYQITVYYNATGTTYSRIRCTIGGIVITGDSGSDWTETVDNFLNADEVSSHPY